MCETAAVGLVDNSCRIKRVSITSLLRILETLHFIEEITLGLILNFPFYVKIEKETELFVQISNMLTRYLFQCEIFNVYFLEAILNLLYRSLNIVNVLNILHL